MYEARLLLSKVTGLTDVEIIALRELSLEEGQREEFFALVQRRLDFEPMAYILGQKEFLGRSFLVDRSVLIPRPETEELVLESIRLLKNFKISGGRILELGTGSGCIAISLYKELAGGFEVVAIDSSEAALKVAQKNAENLGARPIQFLKMDMKIPQSLGSFDLIVSNPPYLCMKDAREMTRDILDYEPAEALFAGESGFEFYEAIIQHWLPSLNLPGILGLETANSNQRKLLSQKLSSLSLHTHTCHLFGVNSH